MQHDEDEGLDLAGDRHLISDRDLDTLGEALVAWDAREDFARWWERGSLDEASHHAA